MAGNLHYSKKFQVRIFSDSRGAFLDNEFRKLNDPRVFFKTRFLRGAGLARVWELVEEELLRKRADLIFVLAGVCDTTDCYYSSDGTRFFWPPSNTKARFLEIKTMMGDMLRNYLLLEPTPKLCFIPDPGVDLIRYNSLMHPVDSSALQTQSKLEECFRDLQEYTRKLNRLLGVKTPWTLNISHAHRSSNMVPVYDRMSDGIHFSRYQAAKLAATLRDFVRLEFIDEEPPRLYPIPVLGSTRYAA